GRFFLFHRRRLWNPSEGCWMGWERKRGKLMELNRFLRGAGDTSYSLCIGDQAALESVRYVICLDTDTQLPPGAAPRLGGTLAHLQSGLSPAPTPAVSLRGTGSSSHG